MFDLITWPVLLDAMILCSKLILVTLVIGVAGWHIYFKYFDKETEVEKNETTTAEIICIEEARKKVANGRY